MSLRKYRKYFFFKLFSTATHIFLIFSFISSPVAVYAQSFPFEQAVNLPTPGSFVSLSPNYAPALVTGITIHPDNSLQIDFIMDTGDDHLKGEDLNKDANKLISYFMAALTVPEKDMWVNLSPYEKDRIIAQGLGDTVMGRDMLAQDYLLKQLTASLIYPENKTGSQFWENVYQKAQAKFGSIDIPTDVFNKVWIVPEKAEIYVKGTHVFVIDSHLKVMMEEDYLALEHHDNGLDKAQRKDVTRETKAVFQEIIIPAIEHEVNEGKNFATLRQMFNSMILATWYKKNLRESLLGKIYVDQNKTVGVDVADKDVKNKIYNQYLEAFKKGVFDYVKEEYDQTTQDVVSKKYISGGVSAAMLATVTAVVPDRKAAEDKLAARFDPDRVVTVKMGAETHRADIDRAMNSIYEEREAHRVRVQNPLLDQFLKAAALRQVKTHFEISAEVMLRDVKGFGAGGLGILNGDFVKGLGRFAEGEYATSGVFIGYDKTKDGTPIDYSGNGPVKPVMVMVNGKPQHLKLKVESRGQDEYGNMGREIDGRGWVSYAEFPNTYEVEVYTTNLDGVPALFLRQPQIFNELYPGPPFSDEQKRQFALFARAIGELMKALNISPDRLKLNEGHTVFVPAVIQNDIEYYQSRNQLSVFSRGALSKKDFKEVLSKASGQEINVIWRALVVNGLMDELGYRTQKAYDLNEISDLGKYQLNITSESMLRHVFNVLKKPKNTILYATTHTPVAAGVAEIYGADGIEHLKNIVGWDLVKNYMLVYKNGVLYFNSLQALIRAVAAVNAVSPEHDLVSRMNNALYPEEVFQNRNAVGLTNGSDHEKFRTQMLGRVIDDWRAGKISDKDFREKFELAKTEAMEEFNKVLIKNGQKPIDYQGRPIFVSAHRLTDYKQQLLLLMLSEWLTGDPNKDYYIDIRNPYFDVEHEKIYLGKGQGGVVILGGLPQDPSGHYWVEEMRKLEGKINQGEKARFAYYQATGIEEMKLFASISRFWIHTPFPFEEASGTGDQRANAAGNINALTPGAGHSEVSPKSTSFIDVYGEKMGEQGMELLFAFQRHDHKVIIDWGRKATLKLKEELEKFIRLYATKDKDTQYIDRVKLAITEFFENASLEVFVSRYVRDWFPAVEYVLENGGDMEKEYKLRDEERLNVITLKRIMEDFKDVTIGSERYYNRIIGSFLTPEEERHIRANEFTTRELEDLSKRMRSAREALGSGIIGKFLRTKGFRTKNITPVIRRIERQIALVEETIEYRKDTDQGDQIDAAMLNPGGIDFNSNNMNMKTIGDHIKFDLPLDPKVIQQFNIDGILPVIINITPITSFPMLLGETDPKPAVLETAELSLSHR